MLAYGEVENLYDFLYHYKLYKPFSHCRALTSFFSIRVVNVWNDLPADIVDFRSLQSFKKTISTVDLSKYLSAT